MLMPNSLIAVCVIVIYSYSSFEYTLGSGTGTNLSQRFKILIVNERVKSIKNLIDLSLNKLKSSRLSMNELYFFSTFLGASLSGVVVSSLMSSSNT